MKEKEKEPKMNLIRIDFSKLPMLRGKSTSPRITVAANGQVVLNGKALEMFGASKYAVAQFDSITRTLYFKGVKSAVKNDEGGIVTPEVKTSKKGTGAYFNAAGLFRLPEVNYDYRASGSQNFPAIEGGANGVGFVVPEGALKPRPFTPRKRKAVMADAAAAGATPAYSAPEPQFS